MLPPNLEEKNTVNYLKQYIICLIPIFNFTEYLYPDHHLWTADSPVTKSLDRTVKESGIFSLHGHIGRHRPKLRQRLTLPGKDY